ncbi:SAM-dependent methyltransferase [Saccharopolyspora sp. HNM0986]|uniref:methyltransferase n=1 Tax=Saccharopolyspora galaxeae TaxID=2781241 RepID=UPI001909D0C9|nr:methyltransferase [Saccharopolyspora sp. HNM0986]MBK0870663.1 SAM-dependent methyltransferase [Saccharopolyspora sp. HNM0986]
MSGAQTPEFQLLEQSVGYFYSAALRAAALLNIADHLAGSAKKPDELAESAGVHGPYLHRLLRFLATRDVFAEDDAGRFHLTPSAELLRTDAPRSMRSAVLMLTDQVFWKPAELLDETVRAGATRFEEVFPAPFFDWLAQDEQAGDAFHFGMAAMSDSENRRIAADYDFSGCSKLVDVGGGQGGFLVEVLRKSPDLHGVLFDEEHVLAQHRLGEVRHSGGCEAVIGDFFSAVPPGADAYVLKRILHDWDDEESTRILARCREAMDPDARVLVIDAVIPAGNEPHPGKALDMLLMTSLSGKERTKAEFEAVFAGAGLSVTRVIPTSTPLSIVEGERESG